MKFLDMLQTSANNLWKRKLRSVLTIMGVVIGVASIVVMVSLGLGLSDSMLEEYSSYGSLTQITVSTPYSDGTKADELRLNDELINTLGQLEHVETVYPVLQTNVISLYGAYSAYITVIGMPIEAIENLGPEIGEGRLPSADSQELEFFYGNKVAMNYSNAKTGTDYWSTGVMPDIDYYGGALFTIFDADAYFSSQGGTANNTTPVTPPKKYIVPTCGIQKEDESYSQTSWNVYCDIDKLKAKLKQIFKHKAIPGQPTTKSGKPYPEIFYSQILVDVDEMDNVIPVQQMITDMGYEAYSNAEWISSAMTSMGFVQMVLGGIGAVSLLVAAIGIANTMMMSIYERTKEIGVMKVLGCSLDNIRMMFLLEAAMIGFCGGVAGVGLSYLVSAAINYVSQGSEALGITSSAGGLSRIPIWLALLSIIFAIFISMIAGFMPAQKAMRLSPLAAIRNE